MRSLLLLPSVVVTLALVAAGCGSSSDTADAAADGPESFEDLDYESPLADFLGQPTSFEFTDDDEAEMVAQQNEAEELIAVCMRELGWEYQPVDASQYMSFGTGDEELPWGSKEWTEKYGFGISTQRFSQSAVGPDLVGYEDSEMMTDQDFVDPNADYVEGLSDSERDSYYQALYGNEPALPDDATEEEMQAAYDDWEPDGCANEAQLGMGDPSMAFYDEFGDELDEMYTRIETDPRIQAARDEVTACVAEKGFDYPSDGSGPYEIFEERLADIGFDWETDPFVEAGLDPETMSDQELDDFYADLEKLDDDDLAALAEIQADEIELARIVDDCGGSDLDMAQVYMEVSAEIEQEFLDANADRLADYEGSAGS